MDNKPLEKQAESFIKSQLLKFGFKVHDLSFDEKGSDLMIAKKVSNQRLKFINIQCKGRKLTTSATSITIPISYVQDNFLLFIYIIDKENNESLFLFFPDNIKSWKINKQGEYYLSISNYSLRGEKFSDKSFDKISAEKIEILLNSSEPKEYTSAFIDGIFLEKAVHQTARIYSSILPEKKFVKPNLSTIVRNILETYNKYKTEKTIINCFIFLSESFSIENAIDIDYETQKIFSKDGNQIRLVINKSDEIISFEILEEIERSINNDNILLVANDRAYEYDLSKLKKKGFDIIVIRSNLKDGNDMQSEFRWGDISWPIGLALGLDLNEL